MERRSFLKRLGILAGTYLIPNWLIPAEPEKKGIGQNPYNFPLTDHKPDEFDYKKLKTKDFKEYWENEEYRYGITFYIPAGRFHYPNYGTNK